MSLGLEVAFADSHVFFPDGHLSRVGGTFDGTLAAAAIRDADPAAAPPEIRTMSGETLETCETARFYAWSMRIADGAGLGRQRVRTIAGQQPPS
jgi:hypothetical protein